MTPMSTSLSPFLTTSIDPKLTAKVANIGNAENKEIRQKAEEFESVFLAQMLRHMTSGMATDGVVGGGHAEKIYREMLMDEIGNTVSRKGGIGIADSLFREMIKQQEVAKDEHSTHAS